LLPVVEHSTHSLCHLTRFQVGEQSGLLGQLFSRLFSRLLGMLFSGLLSTLSSWFRWLDLKPGFCRAVSRLIHLHQVRSRDWVEHCDCLIDSFILLWERVALWLRFWCISSGPPW
jgi:hypothetical protein